jgi:hypothetical protein
MSPTILKTGPYRFFFNSREESRMHVHISMPDGTAKFWLEPIVALADYYNHLRRSYGRWKRWFTNVRRISKMLGVSISRSEITSIGPLGFWLLVDDREYFVPFADYPAFKDATVAQIYNVQQLGPEQLHWPELDVDIELDALQHPERFPLQFKPA